MGKDDKKTTKNETFSIENVKKVFKGRKTSEVDKYRHFAVLVPLVAYEGELCLLYEKRSETLRIQPGEVCFPGGFCEENESYLECALRETQEEIGVPPEKVDIIAPIDPIVHYSGLILHCFLGEIQDFRREDMHINKAEVDEIFFVPLKWLADNPPEVHKAEIVVNTNEDFPYYLLGKNGYSWRKGKMMVPFYVYNGKVIWGMTGRITRNFIDILKDSKK